MYIYIYNNSSIYLLIDIIYIQIQSVIDKVKNSQMRSYQNTDTALKDKLILDMKKQLSDLKQLDHQYLKLLDQVKSVQSKYSLLQDDGQRIENQHKIKSDITRTNISQLRNQLDNLKIQIHKYNVNIDQIAREIANFNRITDNRENQIATQMAINQDFQKNNIDQIDVNKNLNQKIQGMKEDRNKCQAQCERLRKLLEENINQLKGFQRDARNVQASNHRHATILQIAEADREQLIQGLHSRKELVNNTQKKLQQLQKEREELKDKLNKLQKQCIKSESDLRQVHTDLDNGINKNKDLSNRLKNQQKILRNAQSDLDKSLLDRQALMNQNSAVSAKHKGLNEQIDRCLLSIIQMERFSEDLQREIKFFIQCDEQARKMLNRKQAMTKMLEQVMNTLHKSGQEIAHLR